MLKLYTPKHFTVTNIEASVLFLLLTYIFVYPQIQLLLRNATGKFKIVSFAGSEN